MMKEGVSYTHHRLHKNVFNTLIANDIYLCKSV